MMSESYATVLFDGDCNLCDKTVRFIFARDPRGRFRFAPLQSTLGQELTSEHGISVSLTDPYSVLLLENGVVYDRSTAALRIVRQLTGPVRFLGAFLLLPRPLRDLGYRLVARVRYKIWGKKENCDLPPPGLRERFLAF
jgi:predicted DCC family thiol-disulfide oxidoreductase YuxK